MKLYSYFRSSAAYRVRIALNLKGIDYQLVPINLLKGEHLGETYKAMQPQGLVPCMQLERGEVLTQSGAILAYIEAKYPQHPLMPEDLMEAVKIRSLIDMIACDIHPVNNLRVLKYLSNELTIEDEQKQQWYRHWIEQGFEAIEHMLAADNSPSTSPAFAMGDQVTMVDVYLVPQVYNALRFKVDMQPYPRIMRAYQACNNLDAFIQAAPENQPDSTL
ncbi:maleylacetoacetate isomerase [Paraglaciecola sp. T6c]|uniref:maleylacetoacetate isomerase n=1 Tax=Pseudoalteromonas atlantica (strain T6c / ATCC BAA-1087) TaxID=3042615 RepID=UPI00005C6942|nr:maleylacetoacetate isomerase [Paraglaciecola sp. T6c]ABG39971.1 maleylacetoacetate isomerase [Paraglaciecola sp. T6c]